MLFNLIKRGIIYGYFLFIGYTLINNMTPSNQEAANKQFTESITKFETQHETLFKQIYEKVPQLVQFKFIKYPLALIGFSSLSIIFGGGLVEDCQCHVYAKIPSWIGKCTKY